MHLAFIPDGNRRWAASKGLKLAEAYEVGIKKVKDVAEWSLKHGADQVSFWGFSTDNFNRSESEKAQLFALFRRFLMQVVEELSETDKVSILFTGDIDRFPKDIADMMRDVMSRTKGRSKIINIYAAYGGREEIAQAAANLSKQGKEITVESISKEISPMLSDIDIIVRTSGEKRFSNFALWKGAYAEFVFLDKYWPELTEQDIEKIFADFKSRERRFGK
ncbi:MAG: polyprenyl diphosphate synthase [Candidatus Anstonellales archaeon]